MKRVDYETDNHAQSKNHLFNNYLEQDFVNAKLVCSVLGRLSGSDLYL